MTELLTLSVFSGLIWASIGYASAKVKSNEEFDARQFIRTAIIGFVLGAIALLLNVKQNEMESYAVIQLLTIVTDKAVTALERKRQIQQEKKVSK